MENRLFEVKTIVDGAEYYGYAVEGEPPLS